MLSWFTENLGTILISAAILLAAALAARSVYRTKKSGSMCSSGGNCACCDKGCGVQGS